MGKLMERYISDKECIAIARKAMELNKDKNMSEETKKNNLINFVKSLYKEKEEK